jgi:Glycosyl transferase family 2
VVTGIDVVLPTIGRQTLERALDSVRSQTLEPRRLFIVDDSGASAASRLALRQDEHLLATSGGEGAGASRERGRIAGTSPLIAYLDDDDWWEPDKLEVQASRLGTGRADISFTRVFFHRADGRIRTLPRQPPPPLTDDIPNYLLERPRLLHGDGYIQSSTLMVRRNSGADLAWRPLMKHEDWDLLMRAAATGARFDFCDQPLVHIQQGSLGSLSMVRDWVMSVDWLSEHKANLSRRAVGDFIAVEVLRGALASRDAEGVRTAVRMLRGNRPHAAALIVGISGLLKRRQSRASGARANRALPGSASGGAWLGSQDGRRGR